MPIYEFYCRSCHTIYNFFSKRINTRKIPACPKCRNQKLSRQVSLFAIAPNTAESDAHDDGGLDEARLERALAALGSQVEKIDENDPRQAADLMRKLTDMSGLQLGNGMEEALARLEKGEDPDAIEADLGKDLESEDPFLSPARQVRASRKKRRAPQKDDTLYEL